jgi:hypothetical protein
MSWNDTYIFWNVETSNNSFLFQVMSINDLFTQEYMDALRQKVDYQEQIGKVSMGNFYMFITPNLIDKVTTFTAFEALGNLKSQTPKLSHTLINSVVIQPYAIQHPLCQLATKHDNNFVGFQHFCLCVSDDPFSTYPGQVQGSKLMKESVTQIWIMLVDVFKTKVKSQCVN